jgi:hypothetical protein
MSNSHKIILTVTDTYSDEELKIMIGQHSDINDWIKVFKTILIHRTFHEDLVKELFEEYQI